MDGFKPSRRTRRTLTYLGVKESELPELGLKKATNANRDFWVPDI